MSKPWWSKGYYSGYWRSSRDDDDDYYDSDSSSSGWDWWGSSKKEDYSWKDAYKSRYKSSLGYSTSRLSETVSSSSSWYGRSSGTDIDKAQELLSKVYRSTRDMIVILDFPFNVKIQLSCDGSEIEGGLKDGSRRVFIPTKILDESGYSDSEKINICCGLGVHEASHLKFTEYKVLTDFSNRLCTRSITIDGKTTKLEDCILFIISLINLIEDERIENLLLQERPGYTEFIDIAKSYQYKNFIKYSNNNIYSAFEKEVQFKLFMNNLFRLIRYPEDLDEDTLEKYSEQYKAIQKFLNPLPQSTKEACIAGLGIYKEIISTFPDLELKTKGSDKKLSLGHVVKMLSKYGKAFEMGFVKVNYGSDSDSGSAISGVEISSKIKDSSILSKLITGMAERGEKKSTYFENIKGNAENYRRVANQIQKSVPAIKKLIKNTDRNYDFNIYGCRSGILDTAKLAEAYQGVPQVYIRQGQVRTNKSTVCVVIDESGSMGTDWVEYSKEYRYSYSTKMTKAREAAILLNEALGSLPGVDLYIYGHTADITHTGSTDIRIYKEGKKHSDPYALGMCGRRLYENRDGVALYEVGKRVRKFTSSPVTMFVISDGEPSACDYRGLAARHDTRENVKKLENDGFSVIQVTIDNVCGAEDMFKNVIDLRHGVDELPKLLGNIIKKAVVADKKTTIS
ncbi:MAG: hypothetical protein J6I84_03850 [Bacilli bacterium]|nr:hypothetical protein [Bacilli bacterium]